MKRRAPELDPELESLLRFRKVTRQLPQDVRARVLARSRAFVSGRRVIFPVASVAGPRPPATGSAQGGSLRRLSIAAALAILAGTAGALAALRSRVVNAPLVAIPQSTASISVPVREETGLDAEPDTVTTSQTTATHHPMTGRPRPAPKRRDADPLAEVELLQHAHLAYARRDFRGALALVAEHTRRFPDGPLAEECQALRVESLLAAGNAGEAGRAAAAFAKRFPRSVLLPGIEATSHEGSAP